MADAPLPIRFPEKTWRFVRALIDQGTYGDNKSEVIRRFVDEGIRRAIEKGHIPRDPP